MQRIRHTIAVASGLGLAGLMLTPAPAFADTESCVSLAEYDNTVAGLSPVQVATRYDVYGVFIGDTDHRFKRAYRSCWAPGQRQAVVVYSYDDTESVNWYVRDAPQ